MPERVAAIEAPKEQNRLLRKELGAWLKRCREDAGLTQAELAEQLGLRYYSFVSQVENGIGRMPQDLYPKWADAVKIEHHAFGMRVLEHLEPGLFDMISPTKR